MTIMRFLNFLFFVAQAVNATETPLALVPLFRRRAAFERQIIHCPRALQLLRSKSLAARPDPRPEPVSWRRVFNQRRLFHVFVSILIAVEVRIA
jgi:hypothetical protein